MLYAVRPLAPYQDDALFENHLLFRNAQSVIDNYVMEFMTNNKECNSEKNAITALSFK